MTAPKITVVVVVLLMLMSNLFAGLIINQVLANEVSNLLTTSQNKLQQRQAAEASYQESLKNQATNPTLSQQQEHVSQILSLMEAHYKLLADNAEPSHTENIQQLQANLSNYHTLINQVTNETALAEIKTQLQQHWQENQAFRQTLASKQREQLHTHILNGLVAAEKQLELKYDQANEPNPQLEETLVSSAAELHNLQRELLNKHNDDFKTRLQNAYFNLNIVINLMNQEEVYN